MDSTLTPVESSPQEAETGSKESKAAPFDLLLAAATLAEKSPATMIEEKASSTTRRVPPPRKIKNEPSHYRSPSFEHYFVRQVPQYDTPPQYHQVQYHSNPHARAYLYRSSFPLPAPVRHPRQHQHQHQQEQVYVYDTYYGYHHGYHQFHEASDRLGRFQYRPRHRVPRQQVKPFAPSTVSPPTSANEHLHRNTADRKSVV